MKSLLNDPQTEVHSIIVEGNPAIAQRFPAVDSFIPYKVVPNSAGGKNSILSYYGNTLRGVQGLGTVQYDRIDLAKMFNNFNGVFKRPKVIVFEAEGTTFKPTDRISQINTVLGTNLVTTGEWADVTSAAIVAPVKDGTVNGSLNATTVTTGVAPYSLRLIPSTKVDLAFVNKGARVSDIATVRSLFPLSKSDSALNWNIANITNPLATLRRSRSMMCYDLDFSEIFGLTESANCVRVGGSTGAYIYAFTAEALAAINTKLTSNDLPPLLSTFTWVYSSTSALSAWVNGIRRTNATVNLPQVNKNYTYSLAIPSSALAWDVSNFVDETTYLNYNLLT